MDRKQTDYNKLVGKKDGDYYFCDYIFDDGNGFKGATGTELRPVPKDEYERRTNPEYDECKEYFRELWQMSVNDGKTEQSLDEWISDVLMYDGDEAIFDFSGYNLWEQLRELGLTEEEYPVFECSGGGRCFSSDIEFDEVYDEELLKKIKEIEKC